VKLTSRGRRFAAVLVVVFVLTTVWAAYYLYAETHPMGESATGPTVATFTERSVGGFAAALRPSYLYNNSTEVYGGNITLFTPITNWINASVAFTLQTSRAAAIHLGETFVVVLSTPVWSKTLFTEVNQTSPTNASLETISVDYSVNVSSVVSLASAINAQLGYQGNEYTLSLDPAISGSVAVAGVEQTFADEPTLNFTFEGSLIKPSGLQYTTDGALVAPPPPAASSGVPAAVPYLALVGSVGGLGSSVWVATRRSEEEQLPPLDELIRPYEEAIVTTARAPTDVTATPVKGFADLVKIADTLGKPILRPTGPDPTRSTFFVVDGLIAYSYRYPGARGTKGPSEPLFTALTRPTFPPGSAKLIRRLQRELLRLKGLPLDDETAALARERVRRAMDLIRAGNNAEAALEIDHLARVLTVAAGLSRPPRS